MNIQKQILMSLDNADWDIFTNSDLKNKIKISITQTNEALHKLIKNGDIRQLERGKYCRHNFSDENVIGSFIVKTGGIAYLTAMYFHGLTEQIPNMVYVQSIQAKRNITIFGVRYRFIKVKSNKLTGFKTLGYGNNQFQITDVEKTVIDCFDLPQYGGGYNEIIKAFFKANLSAKKMVKYCKAIDNITVTKRLAYLCELLEKPKMDYFIKYAQAIRNEKYNLFESDGNKKGKTNRRWRLVLNMEEDKIIEIANS